MALNFEHQIFFSDNLVEHLNLPYTYVEPGTTQHYRIVVDVPYEADLLLLNAKFKYKHYWEHSAEKIVDIKNRDQVIGSLIAAAG